jgi:negative regulator of sigma E activity
MSKGVNESISSLFDDELDAVERSKLIDKLKHSNEHQDVWNRYSLMSQALKRDLPASPSHDLFSRVQTAIESEPALLSPSPSTIGTDVSAEVIELPKKNEAVSHRKSNPMLGFAVAASFALMTIVGFQFISSNNDIAPGLPIASNQTVTPNQNIQIVTRPNDGITTVSTGAEEPLYAEQSVINDGQWTRITHIGNMALNGHVIDRSSEAHANVNVPANGHPFTRPVNMGSSTAQ